jgi:N-acetylmuramoyl-L-alanine amidase
MKTFFTPLYFSLMVIVGIAAAIPQLLHAQTPPVTGLSGWSLYIDPGHSQTENMGLYNYSEAQKVLRVGLYLRDMLLTMTDIDTVYMARTNDAQLVGLTQRIELANTLGADFYYSIHSDAGAPGTNSTLMLWGANGLGVEKTPQGGKRMGDIMDVDLTASMRIGRRGSRADSPFYGAPTTRTTPWLAVNRISVMASVLSEAGFHTNPTQQMRNINAEWKKLEAQSAFWSILAYNEIARPQVGIVTGFITNQENGQLINGASVRINGKTYTTDTYESVFFRHSNNPQELRNGFFYLEDFEPGSTHWAVFSAPGFFSDSVQVTVNPNFFTFRDFALVSTVPPTVTTTNPAEGEQRYDPRFPIMINFSRGIAAASLAGNISFEPNLAFTSTLVNPTTLQITSTEFQFMTNYSLTLSDDIVDLVGHKLDGNSDGIEGGTFTLNFRVGAEDVTPPAISKVFPDEGARNIDRQPIVSFELDEIADPATITAQTVRITLSSDENPVPVSVHHYTVNGKTVIQAFPLQPLAPNTEYYAWLMPGVADMFGNARTGTAINYFDTGSNLFTYRVIDNFNAGVDTWWVPQQSGSTVGIVTEQTSRVSERTRVNPVTGSTGGMALNYGWLTTAGTNLIRQYLPPTATQNSVRLNNQEMLEVFVFGDGSGNQFRFMLRDADAQLEGSPWYTVDWLGWRLVRWNLATTPATGWVNGNNTVAGQAYTDSFQLQWIQGRATSGTFIFDDYRIANISSGTSVEDPFAATLPQEVMLMGNYPNPFNPTTSIRFALPESMDIQLDVFDMLGRQVGSLARGTFTPGTHTVNFDASALSSGVYIYRLVTPTTIVSGKMMLVK